MLKKYVRILSWKLLQYTERWFDLDQILKMIDRGEYYRAQIRLDKLRDHFGNDPRFDGIQTELDFHLNPIPLDLKSSEKYDEEIFKIEQLQ